MQKVNMEVKNVIEDSKKGRRVDTNKMDMSQMADLIREMPKVEELMKKYQIHMDLSNQIITEFQKNKKKDIITLE